ncbi:MAG: alkaline phosphatase [Phycisphaerales bacterium]
MWPALPALIAAITLHPAPVHTLPAEGSAIFIHPDGTGLGHWGLGRVMWAGPDGDLAWDTLPAMAIYRPHVKDSLAPQSHSGATVHAYGVKVPMDSFGMDGAQIPLTPAGERLSIMRRAMREGKSVGVVNSGHLAEPGTAVFLASVTDRARSHEIVAKQLEGRPNVVLGGGEAFFLPKGAKGRHGAGTREDGRDLVSEARAAGYTVVFTREELAAVPAGTTHLLGLFASSHTFNGQPEEVLLARGATPYLADAPTVAEMQRAALRVLEANPKGFLLVVEEEGSDNMSNANNAAGLLEAMRRADEAIADAIAFRARRPETLVLVAADSDAGRPQLLALPEKLGVIVRDRPLPAQLPGDPAPIDGIRGPLSPPFLSAPDRHGARFPFAVAWASLEDGGDPVVVRAEGPGSELVRGSIDSTAVYRVLFEALFGSTPEAARDAKVE